MALNLKAKRAVREQCRLRMAISGPSGSGKTMTAIKIAKNLGGGKVALLDTEYRSASKYDHLGFDVIEVTENYNPALVGEFIAQNTEYDTVVIDSMTHFWNGPGGFLDLVNKEGDAMKARGHKVDSFAAWKNITPIYNRMIHSILSAPMNVIVTLRAKTEYEKEKDANGKTSVRKVGTAPEMRDNFQYEMDIEGLINIDHQLVIGKTRCDALDGKIFNKPGKDIADIISAWLTSGAPATPKKNDDAERLRVKLSSLKTKDEVKKFLTDSVSYIEGLPPESRAECIRVANEFAAAE